MTRNCLRSNLLCCVSQPLSNAGFERETQTECPCLQTIGQCHLESVLPLGQAKLSQDAQTCAARLHKTRPKRLLTRSFHSQRLSSTVYTHLSYENDKSLVKETISLHLLLNVSGTRIEVTVFGPVLCQFLHTACIYDTVLSEEQGNQRMCNFCSVLRSAPSPYFDRPGTATCCSGSSRGTRGSSALTCVSASTLRLTGLELKPAFSARAASSEVNASGSTRSALSCKASPGIPSSQFSKRKTAVVSDEAGTCTFCYCSCH